MFRTHLAGQNPVRTVFIFARAVNADLHLLKIGRNEKRKSLDVIPMRMRDEQMEFVRLRIARDDVLAEFADARTGVADEKRVVKPHLDARGVAAIDARPARRRRNRAACSPEFYEGGHFKFRDKQKRS